MSDDLSSKISERMAAFRHSYAPVFKVTCEGRPYHAGTITSVVVDGRQVLVTAGHVLERDQDNKCDEENQIYMEVGGKISQVQKFQTGILPLGKSKLDLSVIIPVEVGSHQIIQNPIPQEAIWPTASRTGLYMAACGFPQTKNKRKGSELSRAPYGYFGTNAADEITKKAGYDPNFHFAIKIDLKRVFANGQSGVIAPNPQGISGGPVFVAYDHRHPTAAGAHLIGIVIARDKKKKHLICVKAELITFIARELFKMDPAST